MLSRKNRLTTKLFLETMQTGSAVHSTNIWLKYKRTGDSDGRFSVSVPKKIVSGAVLRNRIRRRLYSVIIPKKGIQGIIFAKSSLEKVNFEEIRKEVALLLDKASLQ